MIEILRQLIEDAMDNFEDEYEDGVIIDTICTGCDLFRPVNDLSLCDECFAKLERDLIRSRDWEYSATALMVADDQLEALRERVIRDYGAAYHARPMLSGFTAKAGRSRCFGPNPEPDFSGDFHPASCNIKQERRST
jgi:hypothetical protein